MNDTYILVMKTLRDVWHRRWYAIAVAWLLSGVGWAVVANLPDQYKSSALIYVDRDSYLNPLMRGLAPQVDNFQRIATNRKTLLSRPNLEKVVIMTDMDLSIKTDVEREAVFTKLRTKIKIVSQDGNQSLFLISYIDSDPEMAKRVVQAILQIFVEGQTGASHKDMEVTRRFIDGQIHDYETQLNASESKIADFKSKNMGFLPGEGNFYTELERRRAEVDASEAKQRQAKSHINELRRQVRAIPKFLEIIGAANGLIGGGAGLGPGSDTQLRIMELEETIDGLLTLFTDKHPDVLAGTRRLKKLQSKLAREQEEARIIASGPGSRDAAHRTTSVPNPVYQKLKIQLAQASATYAALQSGLDTERNQVKKWLELANLVPQVEAELQRLTRDNALLKKNYDALRARKESAKIARDLETKTQKVQFRIVDPPKVPVNPAGPPRLIFTTAVLFAAIIGGLAFAFLLCQINSTISTVDALRSKFSLPVLGSITAIISPLERRRRIREITGFAAVGVSLIFAYIGFLAIQTIGAQQLIAKFGII